MLLIHSHYMIWPTNNNGTAFNWLYVLKRSAKLTIQFSPWLQCKKCPDENVTKVMQFSSQLHMIEAARLHWHELATANCGFFPQHCSNLRPSAKCHFGEFPSAIWRYTQARRSKPLLVYGEQHANLLRDRYKTIAIPCKIEGFIANPLQILKTELAYLFMADM